MQAQDKDVSIFGCKKCFYFVGFEWFLVFFYKIVLFKVHISAIITAVETDLKKINKPEVRLLSVWMNAQF